MLIIWPNNQKESSCVHKGASEAWNNLTCREKDLANLAID